MEFKPFEPEQAEVTEFSPFEEENIVQGPSDRTIKDMAAIYSSVYGSDPAQVEFELKNGLAPKYEFEATVSVNEADRQNFNQTLEQRLANESSLYDVVEEYNKFRENTILGDTLPGDLRLLLQTNQGQLPPEMRNQMTYVLEVQRMIQDKQAEVSTGFFGGAADFVDFFVSETLISPFTQGSRNDAAKELWQLAGMSMSVGDKVARAKVLIDEMAEQGMGGLNQFYLGSFLAQAEEGGVGDNAALDRIFGAIDAAGAVSVLARPFVVGAQLRKLARSRDIVDTFEGLGNETAATATTVRAADEPANFNGPSAGQPPNVEVPRHTAPYAMNPSLVDDEYLAGPWTGMRTVEAQNAIVEILKKTKFARGVDDATMSQAHAKLIADYVTTNAALTKRMRNVDVIDSGFENYNIRTILGKSNGTLFRTVNSAQRYADNVGGEVIGDPIQGYAVKVYENINVSGFVDKTNLSEVLGSSLSGIFSTAARTTKELKAIIVQAEAALGVVGRDIGAAYAKVARKVNKIEFNGVNSVLRELQSDPLVSGRRQPYTRQEFVQRYTLKTGHAPSQKAVDYYLINLELNDAEYFLAADGLVKKAVDNGEKMVKIDGVYTRVRPVSDVGDAKVFDTGSNSFKDQAALGKGTTFEVFEDDYLIGGKPVQYVHIASPQSRRIWHDDVLSYNAGGPRSTKDANYILKQDGVMETADGRIIPSKPRSFMYARSEAEARAGMTQVNDIISGALAYLPPLPNMSKADYRNSLRGATGLDSLVRANNAWNVDIDLFDEFLDFADKYNLDLSKPVSVAAHAETTLSSRFAQGSGNSQFRLAPNRYGRRGDDPLTAYGGVEAETLDPTVAIERSFIREVNRFSEKAYVLKAIGGWLKAADDADMISNKADLLGMTPRQAMDAAIISDKYEAGRKLINERNTINFRLNTKTVDVVWWENSVKNIADYVYNKGFVKTAHLVDKAGGDPTKVLRAMAFHAKLGLFAIDQMMVQASQIINIVALSPKSGMKGALSYLPLRAALIYRTDPNMVLEIARRVEAMGLTTAQDFVDMFRWVDESGRAVIDNSVVDLQGDMTFYRSAAKRFLDKGRMPFNEGEIVARLTAISTAWNDYKRAFPNGDPFSDQGRKWIARENDKLTASMTSASAAKWQKSLLSLPTQFLTYQVRMAEQLFIPGMLTPGEKARLLGTQALVFGGAGVIPFGFVADKYMHATGLELDPQLYSLMRYGALDAILSQITGADTAMSGRLGLGDGFADLWRNWHESNIFEVFGGPGLSIGRDAWDAVYRLGNNMFKGDWQYASYDWQALGRNVKSVNMAYNYWFASRTGQYLRKNGDPLLDNLDESDAIALGLGIPLQELEGAFTLYQFHKADEAVLAEHGKKMSEMLRIMRDYAAEGDWQNVSAIGDNITAMWVALTPYEQDEVYKQFRYGSSDFFESMLQMTRDKRGQHWESGLANTLEGIN